MKNTEYTDMKSRFRILAGIIKEDTLATLTIPNGSTIVELKILPTWFDKLKYKLCGFEYKIVRKEPYTTIINNENVTEGDLDDIIKELETEVTK